LTQLKLYECDEEILFSLQNDVGVLEELQIVKF